MRPGAADAWRPGGAEGREREPAVESCGSTAPMSSGANFPDEHPTRPREYHGARTLVVAVLVLAAVAIPLWLTLGNGAGPDRGGDLGPAARPAYLLPPDLPDAALPPDDAIGRLAPDFELETLDGGRFRLSDWAGHPVVLNFWASWCAPCRREMPVLIRLQEQYREAGLIVVGVNIEEARSPAGDFAAEFGINFALPMDFDGAVTRRYGIGGTLGPPHTMFLDADGVIRTIFRGQAPDANSRRRRPSWSRRWPSRSGRCCRRARRRCRSRCWRARRDGSRCGWGRSRPTSCWRTPATLRGAGASRTSAGGPCCWSSPGRTAPVRRRAAPGRRVGGGGRGRAVIVRTPSPPLATVADVHEPGLGARRRGAVRGGGQRDVRADRRGGGRGGAAPRRRGAVGGARPHPLTPVPPPDAEIQRGGRLPAPRLSTV